MTDDTKKKARTNRESPFTGKYWDNEEPGIYSCAKCHTQLFSSNEKFDAGEGWPTFHKPFDETALQFKPDPEVQNRIEIRCKKCKSQLGFYLSDKNHYRLDSLALKFTPTKPATLPAERTPAPFEPAGLLPATLGPASTLFVGIFAGLILGASGTFLYCKNACTAAVSSVMGSSTTPTFQYQPISNPASSTKTVATSSSLTE